MYHTARSRGVLRLLLWGFLGVFLFFDGSAAAKAKTEVDVHIDRDYDFSKIKSLYPQRVRIEHMPENIALSLPDQLDDWMREALTAKNVKSTFVVRTTKDIWQRVQLLHGPFDFKEPFESDESTAFFYSHLDGTCSAVLKATVSLDTERKWQEPRTETYTTTERIHSRERRRRSDGKYEYVDVYTDVPVTKQRTIPGYWYTLAESKCRLELYDASNMDGKYVAAANVAGWDADSEGDSSMPRRLMKKTVIDAVAAIFHKKK